MRVRAWAVVVAAGEGRRMRPGRSPSGTRKAFLELDGRPMLVRTLEAVAECPELARVVVVVAPDDVPSAESLLIADRARRERLRIASIVPGGARRQDSVAAGLAAVPGDVEIVAVHDGARPLVNPELFTKSIEAAARCGAAVVSLPAVETLRRAEDEGGRILARGAADRSGLWAAQTPQTFRACELRRLLDEAEAAGLEVTDDASLFERAGLPVELVSGERRNIKVTTPEDLEMAEALLSFAGRGDLRVGTGFDVHRLVPAAGTGRRLVVCGVNLDSDLGALGHSDADAACHAVIDAMLGACALGDIGQLFPDTEAAFKDADSLKLLAEATRRVREAGFEPRSVDVTVVLERPKLAPFTGEMRRNLSGATGLAETNVSVKAKTAEGLGPVGECKAVEAHAVAVVAERGGGAERDS